jgi:hypothetical protein
MSKRLLFSRKAEAKARHIAELFDFEQRISRERKVFGEEVVVLPPTENYRVDDIMVMNNNMDNYNWRISEMEDFVQNIIIPNGGVKKKVLVAVFDTAEKYRSKWLKNMVIDEFGFNSSGDDDPFDNNFHSSHVLGSCVGKHPNFRMGLLHHPEIEQFAWGAGRMVLRRQGSGGLSGINANLKNFIQLVKSGKIDMDEWVIVTNHSYGGNFENNEMKSLFEELASLGVFNVASAGNSGDGGPEENRVGNPGRDENTWAIGSVDPRKVINNFSSRSSERRLLVDYVAGGSGIYSAGVGENEVRRASGTSMSSPAFTSLIGWLGATFPDIKGMKMMKKFIEDELEDLGDGGKDRVYGYGLLNLVNFDYDEPIEDPDNPDKEDPIEDPVEEPEREMRAIKAYLDNQNPLFWRRLSEGNDEVKVVDIEKIRYNFNTDKVTEKAHKIVREEMFNYFNNGRRLLVLRDDMDVNEAVLWGGRFMEIIVGKKLNEIGIKDFQLVSIVGYGEGAGYIWDEEDFDRLRGNAANKKGDEKSGKVFTIDNIFKSPLNEK